MQAFRFVAAPTFRIWCVGTGSQGILLYYALPRNDGRIPPILQNDKMTLPVKRMRYLHFGCNIVHEDLAYEKGVNVIRMLIMICYYKCLRFIVVSFIFVVVCFCKNGNEIESTRTN